MTANDIDDNLDLKADVNDPQFNITGFGDNKTLRDIITEYLPPVDLSTVFNDPLFNLTDLGDIKSLSEIVNAFARTGGGGADLSDGHGLVSREFITESF
jgi:hypothetical protein